MAVRRSMRTVCAHSRGRVSESAGLKQSGAVKRPLLLMVLPALMAASAIGGMPEHEVPVTAFVDVTVIPAYGDRHRENQTVLVQGDRITAAGPVSQIKVPRGARRL